MLLAGALLHPFAPTTSADEPRGLIAADATHPWAITAICREHPATGEGSVQDTVPDAAEIGRRLEAAGKAGLPCLVAEDGDGQMRGFTCARPFRTGIVGHA